MTFCEIESEDAKKQNNSDPKNIDMILEPALPDIHDLTRRKPERIPKPPKKVIESCPMLKIGRRKDLFETNNHLTSVVCVCCLFFWLLILLQVNSYCEQMRKLILTN